MSYLDEPASEKQKNFVRGLYRQTNIYCNTLTDNSVLDAWLLENRSVNPTSLTKGEAGALIDKLKKTKKQQRGA